ncbi:37585_t:CDS:1, partial [Gigaspora margarita]
PGVATKIFAIKKNPTIAMMPMTAITPIPIPIFVSNKNESEFVELVPCIFDASK